MNRAIASQVRPALRKVARSTPYFTKREVVHEVLRRADIASAIVEIRRTWRGRGLDEAILGYIENEVSRALRQRDERGMRVYECYATGSERRWRKFVDMDSTDVSRVLGDLRTMRDALDAKVRAYEIVERHLSRRNGGTVRDVYDAAWTEIVGAAIPVDRMAS